MIWKLYEKIRHTRRLRKIILRHRYPIQKTFYYILYFWTHIRRKEASKPIIILSMERCGSYLLMEYLSAVGEFSGEVLNPTRPQGLDSKRFSRQQALNHIKNCVNTIDSEVGGCKLIFSQMEQFHIRPIDILKEIPRARFIVLYRKDLLKQYVSLVTAKETGQWVLREGKNKSESKKVKLDIDSFFRFVAQARKNYEGIIKTDTIRQRSIFISYEDIADTPQEALQNIFKILGENQEIEFKSHIRKQGTRPLEEIIENYDELVVDATKLKNYRDMDIESWIPQAGQLS